MAALANKCPSCQDELTTGMSQHCQGRSKPCGWVRHVCGALVDPRSGRFSKS